MVPGSRIEGGAIISARVRKTILSIKEIVGDHSEADIYTVLKETNMDPNETTQKLLNQDPFHEVRRKRDKKKESNSPKGSAEPRKHAAYAGEVMKFHASSDHVVQRGNYTPNHVPGISREFRVVRDNRHSQNIIRESKPVLHLMSANKQGFMKIEKGSTGTSSSPKPSSGHYSSQVVNGRTNSQSRHFRDTNSIAKDKKDIVERQLEVLNAVSQVQTGKSNDSLTHSTSASNNSVLGVYSSSSDPVHVPSPDSKSSVVRAIKREVGVVGIRQQSSDNPVRSSSSNFHLGRDVQRYRPFDSISKSDQPVQNTVAESAGTSVSAGKSFLSSYQNIRPHQQTGGHQKVSHPSKEWKPKSSKKTNPGVIGVPAKSVSPSPDKPKDMKMGKTQLQDELSRVNISENQNVIIAQHIRVADTDRCKLIFGSFGSEVDSLKNNAPAFQAAGAAGGSTSQPSASLPVSAQGLAVEEATGSKQVDILPDQVRHSAADSSVSFAAHEPQLSDKRDSSSPQNLDSYADIGLVRENSPSYSNSDSQQQDPVELPNFSAYDPQTGYDIPYFRPSLEEPVCGQDVRHATQESLSSHTSNNIPASTIAMMQQQPPPPVAQMYPQVHVSHFPNLMPYRQLLSPVYVPPQMTVPGYTNNPSYPHPSNGSSYLLMPGVNSPHLSANSVKYGIQQFKPVPAGTPTGFGNFSGPTGYAISAPGVAGNPSGLEDSSRLKYKDGGNPYVPNPQAETSEIWIQNPRDLPGMQSAPYYNMPGQTPHAAFMPAHTGHPSFNAVAAQSSHMQFPGHYHQPPQPAALANPHHLGPAMGTNVGVGVAAAAPGAQVGAYQQPQLGHLNWTANF